MSDWANISAREAMTSLHEHRVVYGLETPDGGWGEVSTIEALKEHGLLAPAFTVHFRSGRVRVASGDDLFHLLREPSAS